MSENTKTYMLAVGLMGIVVSLTGVLLLFGQWQIAGILMMTSVGIRYTQPAK